MSFVFDPLSEEFAADPYAVYAEMRDMEQPYFYVLPGMVMLTRYVDIDTVTTDPKMMRSLVGLASDEELATRQRAMNWHDMPYHERLVQFSLLDSDGDVHRRLRKQVFGLFTGQGIGQLEETVQTFVDGLLDQLADKPRFDFVEEFAAQIPGYVIGHFLGAPEADRQQLRLWSEQVVQFFDVDRSSGKKALAERATKEFHDYLVKLREQREKEPRSDLISHMLKAKAKGAYSDDEFISTCMLILMAGHGSSIDALSSGMHLLFKHPKMMEELRKKPSLMPSALQEMLRFEPPLPFFHRHATTDTTVGGIFYPAGTTFGLLYGAANRDPEAFDSADVFNIERNPNRHLSFGRGAHLCLGNHLARMNLRIVFQTLLKRYRHIELAVEDVKYKPGLSVRGPKELWVALTA